MQSHVGSPPTATDPDPSVSISPPAFDFSQPGVVTVTASFTLTGFTPGALGTSAQVKQAVPGLPPAVAISLTNHTLTFVVPTSSPLVGGPSISLALFVTDTDMDEGGDAITFSIPSPPPNNGPPPPPPSPSPSQSR
ncbi:MAG TPA: hypothetical protein VMS17_22035 [Gemmataceae bacterium]|nr:hypothetical protein [Gemmataceae bacterium]